MRLAREAKAVCVRIYKRQITACQSAVSKCFSGKNLLITNTLTSGCLFALGDFIEQKVEERRGWKSKHDYERSARLMTVGLIQGPPHHYWYFLLDKYFPAQTASVAFKKIILDQLIAAPLFAIIFFVSVACMQHKIDMVACKDEFVRKFPTLYIFDWVIWPPTQFINFVFIPSQYRVLYVNAVTVLWDMFLSYIKHFDQFIDTDAISESPILALIPRPVHDTNDDDDKSDDNDAEK